ncbi:putative metallo-phosphoesterase [Caballeronia insecticola]|uniref:Putative metallo-phosphoesterase n=1 Tax=Caballeronia insecticola TaxID=758793 RepID=R4WX80_9BURK|nr:putative metallo-phosphoesterase [Caballeronia insecticola]
MAFNSSARPAFDPAIDPPFEPSSPFRFVTSDLRAGPSLRSESTESSESAASGTPAYVDARLAASLHDSDSDEPDDAPQRYRTIWLSDIHLGSGGCQAPYLLDFLRHHESEYLYLVGDIIDGWQLRKGWFWPQAHNDVVQKILRKARKGTQVVYIPGNHDEAARQFCDLAFGDIHVRGEAFHTTLAGKRLWIVHGDLFDGVIQHAKWLAYLGDTAYTMILLLNRWFNRVRTKLGFNYWSLSQYLKHQVKNAVNFISQFERVMTDEARRRGCDGVVCGHIHKAEIRDIDGVLYCNDGDWVESLSALVETYDGELKIVYWTVMRAPERAVRARATV